MRRHFQTHWALYAYPLVNLLICYFFVAATDLPQLSERSVTRGLEWLVVAASVNLGVAGGTTSIVARYIRQSGDAGQWFRDLRAATICLIIFSLFGIMSGVGYVMTVDSTVIIISSSRMAGRLLTVYFLIGGLFSFLLAWRALIGAEIEIAEPPGPNELPPAQHDGAELYTAPEAPRASCSQSSACPDAPTACQRTLRAVTVRHRCWLVAAGVVLAVVGRALSRCCRAYGDRCGSLR